jgi:hypothetical protein
MCPKRRLSPLLLATTAILLLAGCWQDAKNIAGGDPNAQTVQLQVSFKNLDTRSWERISTSSDPTKIFPPATAWRPASLAV